jgi:hypothetical protein
MLTATNSHYSLSECKHLFIDALQYATHQMHIEAYELYLLEAQYGAS